MSTGSNSYQFAVRGVVICEVAVVSSAQLGICVEYTL